MAESTDSIDEISFESEAEPKFVLDSEFSSSSNTESLENEFSFDSSEEEDVDDIPADESSSIEELSFNIPTEELTEADAEISLDDELATATEARANSPEQELSFNELSAVEPSLSIDEFTFESELPVDAETELSQELSLDNADEQNSELTEPNFDTMSADGSMFEEVSDEFSLDSDDELSFEAMPIPESFDPLEELSFETEYQAESDSQLDREMSSELDSSEDFDPESFSETATETNDFMGQFIDEDLFIADRESDVASADAIDTATEDEFVAGSNSSDLDLSFDPSTEMVDSSSELDFESFSFEDSTDNEPVSDDFDVFIEPDSQDKAIASEPDEFMKELVDENKSVLEELNLGLDEFAIDDPIQSTDETTSTDLKLGEPSAESNFDLVSDDDSAFDALMGAFDNENSSSAENFELQFEDEENLNEQDSLDAVDKKLDELTEISNDSLGELNDLLSSIQDDTVEPQKLDEAHQDK